MSSPASALGSIILAGGQSRRMGQNKALLRLDPAGPTLIERVIAAVQPWGPVLVVTNTPETYAFLGLPMVPDAPSGAPGQGPLAGLWSGLEAATPPYNFVLACDLPHIKPALLAAMAALPRDYDVLVPRWTAPDGGEQLETLHAIYSKACRPAIRTCLERGQRRMISFYPAVRVRYLDEPALRASDPTLASFRNLNTPAEVDAMIHEGHEGHEEGNA
ncbi:MAG TPA: molybdenum cofactor guanylyltransferase [Chloroflexia bacterium]|nr:molybdenum cofactor guanylyltransferase [Chloroflexia bacterium]